MTIKLFKDNWKNLFAVIIFTLVYSALFLSRIQDGSIKIWFQALIESAPLILGIISFDHTLQNLAKTYYLEQREKN